MSSEVTLNFAQLAGALIVAIYLVQLIKSFGYMNLTELRRRAKVGQAAADKVLKARQHGLRPWLILWILLSFMMALMITALDNLISNTWLSLLISAVLLAGLLFALPWAKWPRPNLSLAASASPILEWVLVKLDVVFRLFRPLKLSRQISSDSPLYVHSKENLLDIIQELKLASDSPAVRSDLELAEATLTFSSKKIKAFLTPISAMKTLSLDQTLSPKFINELHNSGFAIFPVRHPDKKRFAGILYFKDVKTLNTTNLPVKEVMRTDIYYVNQQSSLQEVVDAFLKTRQHLFLAVDSSQKIVGLITIADVLRQYLGTTYASDFEYYDDLRLVADKAAASSEKPAKTKNRRSKNKDGRK